MDATFATPSSADRHPVPAAPALAAKDRQFTTLLETSRALLADFASISAKKGARAAALVLAGAIVEGIGFSVLVPLLGVLWGAPAAAGWLEHAAAGLFRFTGAQTQMARLLVLLALFGLLMLLRSVIIAARDVAVASLQIKFAGCLRLRLAQRLAAAGWDQIASLRHARVTQLMGGDIQRLAIGTQLAFMAVAALAMLVAQCILALLLAPVLAALMLLVFGSGAAALGGLMARARLLGEHIQQANLSLLNGTTQFLGGLKLAISQNLEGRFVEETDRTLGRLATDHAAYLRQQARRQTAFSGLAVFLGAGLMLAGMGWFHLPPPVLATLALLVTRMVGPAALIQQGVQHFAHALPIYEKLRDLENELSGLAQATAPPASYPQGNIVFDKVSYRHAGESSAHDFDTAIAPGTFLGITGASGSGKTTFADLLAGLYPPQGGQVRVGGAVLEGGLLTAWRRGLSYVAQDAFLFHDTVRRNLSWARADADEDEMWQALALAGADGLVRRMENGLDTVMGERGTLVSGGERQRIALARALLRKPRLLILDEATGAIDSAGEREILARLRALEPRPTIVIIAHRRENLALCDDIVEFDAKRHHQIIC